MCADECGLDIVRVGRLVEFAMYYPWICVNFIV